MLFERLRKQVQCIASALLRQTAIPTIKAAQVLLDEMSAVNGGSRGSRLSTWNTSVTKTFFLVPFETDLGFTDPRVDGSGASLGLTDPLGQQHPARPRGRSTQRRDFKDRNRGDGRRAKARIQLRRAGSGEQGSGHDETSSGALGMTKARQGHKEAVSAQPARRPPHHAHLTRAPYISGLVSQTGSLVTRKDPSPREKATGTVFQPGPPVRMMSARPSLLTSPERALTPGAWAQTANSPATACTAAFLPGS